MYHTNPATEERTRVKETPLNSIPSHVSQSRKAQKVWVEYSLKERISRVRPLVDALKVHKQELAKTITHDMGKPLHKSIKEVEGSLSSLLFFLKRFPKAVKEKRLRRKETLVYDPKGVIGIISPWNYPVDIPLCSMIVSLLAGNSILHKPSEYCPYVGQYIQRLFDQLPLPQNLVQTIIGGPKHGEVLSKQQIDMLVFTGSSRTGKKIIAQSAPALPKTLLELGGSDPAIIVEDIDQKRTAKSIITLNTMNSGQACCAIKRVYVPESIFPSFVIHLVEEAKKIEIGNPRGKNNIGPLSSKQQLKKIEKIVQDAKKKGAKILTGGKRLKGKGFYYPPTVFTQMKPNMSLLKEEPFGPLLPVIKVKNMQEAIALANETPYGLTASVWTKNIKKGQNIAKKLQAGRVTINNHGKGDMQAPWGGIKESGTGLLTIEHYIQSFMNAKVVTTHKH